MEDSTSSNEYIRIPLPNHALFAVFDGHGGSFAAEYAARNLLRVLCRSEAFCQYADKWRGRENYLRGEVDKLAGEAPEASKASIPQKEEEEEKGKEESTLERVDERQRLQQLQKRGRESDEKVRQLKEQVRRHFDGEAALSADESGDGTPSPTATATLPSCDADIDASDSTDLQVARATYDHALLTLLERSLRDAFVDLDAEILRAVRGEPLDEANAPYGRGYDLSQHTLEGCVGHLPAEAAGNAVMGDDDAAPGGDDPTADHPAPSDDEDAGTTAVVVLTTPRWIACANAGDSRAVYSRSGGRAVPLSYDHKPDDEDEERRIREAGGYVSGGRVEGDLAVSRGLGDYRFKELDSVLSGAKGEGVRRNATVLQRQIASTLKGEDDDDDDVPMLKPSEQKVSPVPDIIVQNRDPKEDEFIVLACDGIWDVQTNQECVRMVGDIFAEGESDLGLVCEEVLDLCLIKGSKDNMTAAVVKFPKQTIGKGGGVAARRERRGASAANDGPHGAEGESPQGHLRRVYNPYVPPAQREQQERKEGDGE